MIWLALILLIVGVAEMRHKSGTGIGLLCLLVAVLLLLVSCGEYEPNKGNDEAINHINSCIAQGRHPITTQDNDGRVFYIACENYQPVQP